MIANVLERLGLLHCRTRVPALVLVMVVLMLQAQRLLLWQLFPDRLAGVGAAEIAKSFAVGLRFDLVIAGMLVVPLLPIMFSARPGTIARRWFKRLVGFLGGFLLGFTALACIADGYFYYEFGMRLNHQVFNYLPEAGNGYIYHDIWTRYPVLWVLFVVLVLGGAGGWLVQRWGFDDRYNVGRLWQGVLWPTAFSLLIALAIRGTVSSHAINASPAFFSPSMPLSQLTLNGLFTLRQAGGAYMLKDVPMDELYDLLEPDRADQLVRELVFTEHDRPVAQPNNPLHRVTAGHRPRRDLNVVLVVLESMHWSYTGHLGGRTDLTPNLDKLAEQAVHTEFAYAVGGRTQRGFAGVVSSFPDIPIASATTRNEVVGKFITLPGLLKQRGYRTMFIYGGPAHRDHRQAYLGSNGVDHFIVEDELPVRTFRTKLGYNDDDLFQSMLQILNDQPADKPFFALTLTLTFHPPYSFPGSEDGSDKNELQRQLDAVRFTDRAIGRFIEGAKQQPWFDNTLFVFVADHSGGLLQHPKGPAMYRIPMIFYGPKIDGLTPRRIGGLHSQMDLAPTVMGLLGGDYEHCFFGRDALADTTRPGYALSLLTNGEIIFYTDTDRATITQPQHGEIRQVTFDPHTGQTRIVPNPSPTPQPQGVAIVQLAHRLFIEQHYDTSPRDTDPNADHASASANPGIAPPP